MAALVHRNLLLVWLAVITLGLGYVAWGQAAAERKVTTFDEISVHRLNIIEPDGKPRVIIANSKRFPGGYFGGKEYRHHNREMGGSGNGGFLFYNDDGDEVGGMLFVSRKQGDHYGASSSLLFDQYHQQETLMLQYAEEDGKRMAGLTVLDQPDDSLLPILELSDQAMRAATPIERDAILKRMKEASHRMKNINTERFFAGKQLGDAVVKLSDSKGRPRMVLKVSSAGEPSIEILDEEGKVTKRVL